MTKDTELSWVSAVEGRPHLALGTAQFMNSYGVVHSNESSLPRNSTEARRLLDRAWELGVDIVETAPAYGLAEAVIGSVNWKGKIWTKLDPRASIADSVDASLRHLRVESIDVLFVHELDRFLELPSAEVERFRRLRGDLVHLLGVSVYGPEELRKAMDIVDFDVIEVPLNVFDTRFDEAISAGQVSREPEYVVRSVLLQGALAQPLKAAYRLGPPLSGHLRHWHDRCGQLDVAPGEAAIRWTLSRKWPSALVLGAENVEQLEQLIGWVTRAQSSESLESIGGANLWPHSDPRSWNS